MQLCRRSPSMRREWIEMADTNNTLGIGEGLPPCGGSGLKLHFGNFVKKKIVVSLHAEGVD